MQNPTKLITIAATLAVVPMMLPTPADAQVAQPDVEDEQEQELSVGTRSPGSIAVGLRKGETTLVFRR